MAQPLASAATTSTPAAFDPLVRTAAVDTLGRAADRLEAAKQAVDHTGGRCRMRVTLSTKLQSVHADLVEGARLIALVQRSPGHGLDGEKLARTGDRIAVHGTEMAHSIAGLRAYSSFELVPFDGVSIVGDLDRDIVSLRGLAAASDDPVGHDLALLDEFARNGAAVGEFRGATAAVRDGATLVTRGKLLAYGAATSAAGAGILAAVQHLTPLL